MSFAAQVSKLTDEYGRPITYRRVVNTGYDTSNRRAVNTITSEFSINAAVRGLKESELAGLLTIGDRMVKFAGDALTITPKKDDQIVISGKVYRVHSVDDIVVNNVTIQYRLIATGDA